MWLGTFPLKGYDYTDDYDIYIYIYIHKKVLIMIVLTQAINWYQSNWKVGNVWNLFGKTAQYKVYHKPNNFS